MALGMYPLDRKALTDLGYELVDLGSGFTRFNCGECDWTASDATSGQITRAKVHAHYHRTGARDIRPWMN